MRLLRFMTAALVCQTTVMQTHAQQDITYTVARTAEASPSVQRLFEDSSFLKLKTVFALAMQKNDRQSAAACLVKMGHTSYYLGFFSQALNYHLQAEQLLQKEKSSSLRAENLSDLGRVLLYNHQLREARQRYNEAFTIYYTLHNEAGIALTNGRMGYLHIKEERFDSAFYCQQQALQYYQHMDDKTGIAYIYSEMAESYEHMKNYNASLRYYQQSQSLIAKTNDTTAYIQVLNNIGDVLRELGRYKESITYTELALRLSLFTKERYYLDNTYRDFARTYHLMGMDDSAYYYLQKRVHYVAEMYSKENSVQMAVLKTMYDVEIKNSEIERLKTRRTIAVIASVVGFLLLLLVGFLVISRQQLRIRNAHLLNKQQEDAHHVQKALLQVQEQELKQELEVRSKELTTHTLHIMQNNQFLEKLHKQLDEMIKDDRRDQRKALKQLQLQINQNINHGKHWDEFHGIFDQVHQAFFLKLKNYCDTLTKSELRLVALLKMNLVSEDIASLLGISQDSARVMRYRLRKKLNLERGESLSLFIQSL